MGGNALAIVGAKTKRLNKKDFELATSKVVSVLNNAISYANSTGIVSIVDAPHEIKAYRQKETFGDLDLLVDSDLFSVYSYEQLLVDMAKEFNFNGELPFKPKDSNDMTFSFGVPDINEPDTFFQIDIIGSKKEYYNFHSSYLNWNDLGNLVGVVASKTKFLKYGHDGLQYLFRDGDNLFASVVLTRDWDEALKMFGYDPAIYKQGFDTLEDIYKFASSSIYFDPILYSFDQRNHVQRIRDRKRPTYNGFLKWIEENDSKGVFASTKKNTPEEWKAIVYSTFPWFSEYEKDTLAKFELDKQIKKEIKKYFNAPILLQYKPELKYEEIGTYLNHLKGLVPELIDFVRKNKEQSIPILIKLSEGS